MASLLPLSFPPWPAPGLFLLSTPFSSLLSLPALQGERPGACESAAVTGAGQGTQYAAAIADDPSLAGTLEWLPFVFTGDSAVQAGLRGLVTQAAIALPICGVMMVMVSGVMRRRVLLDPAPSLSALPCAIISAVFCKIAAGP